MDREFDHELFRGYAKQEQIKAGVAVPLWVAYCVVGAKISDLLLRMVAGDGSYLEAPWIGILGIGGALGLLFGMMAARRHRLRAQGILCQLRIEAHLRRIRDLIAADQD